MEENNFYSNLYSKPTTLANRPIYTVEVQNIYGAGGAYKKIDGQNMILNSWHKVINLVFPQGENPLQWRHNECDGVSNHQPHGCLPKRLFRRRSKKTSKLCVTGLCEGNSPVTGEFPAQRASNAENVSIWWRHHANNIPWRHSASISRVDMEHAKIDREWLFWKGSITCCIAATHQMSDQYSKSLMITSQRRSSDLVHRT